jgi:hypothetical protein
VGYLFFKNSFSMNYEKNEPQATRLQEIIYGIDGSYTDYELLMCLYQEGGVL